MTSGGSALWARLSCMNRRSVERGTRIKSAETDPGAPWRVLADGSVVVLRELTEAERAAYEAEFKCQAPV